MPSILLAIFGYAVLLRVRATPWMLAALAFPGTFAHELSHYLIGFLLRAKPSGFSLWPKRSGKAWRLGAVSFRRVGVLNGAFIALAPLLLLPLGWWCLMRLSVPAWVSGHWLTWLGAGYVTATLFFACTPSLTDIKLGGRSLIFYLVMLGMAWMVVPLVESRLH